MIPATIGPTQRAALVAALHTPNHALSRGPGGWWVAVDPKGKVHSFTTRTVRMLHRAWMLEVPDMFAERATLTPKGLAVAKELDAPAPQAVLA